MQKLKSRSDLHDSLQGRGLSLVGRADGDDDLCTDRQSTIPNQQDGRSSDAQSSSTFEEDLLIAPKIRRRSTGSTFDGLENSNVTGRCSESHSSTHAPEYKSRHSSKPEKSIGVQSSPKHHDQAESEGPLRSRTVSPISTTNFFAGDLPESTTFNSFGTNRKYSCSSSVFGAPVDSAIKDLFLRTKGKPQIPKQDQKTYFFDSSYGGKYNVRLSSDSGPFALWIFGDETLYVVPGQLCDKYGKCLTDLEPRLPSSLAGFEICDHSTVKKIRINFNVNAQDVFRLALGPISNSPFAKKISSKSNWGGSNDSTESKLGNKHFNVEEEFKWIFGGCDLARFEFRHKTNENIAEGQGSRDDGSRDSERQKKESTRKGDDSEDNEGNSADNESSSIPNGTDEVGGTDTDEGKEEVDETEDDEVDDDEAENMSDEEDSNKDDESTDGSSDLEMDHSIMRRSQSIDLDDTDFGKTQGVRVGD